MKPGNVWNRLGRLEQSEQRKQLSPDVVFFVPLTEESGETVEAECRRRFDAYAQAGNLIHGDNVVFYLPNDPQHSAYIHGQRE